MNLIDKICGTQNVLVLVPANGRQYFSDDEVLEDWRKGVDFKLQKGPYCSIRDVKLILEKYDKITINYYRGLVSPWE